MKSEKKGKGIYEELSEIEQIINQASQQRPLNDSLVELEDKIKQEPKAAPIEKTAETIQEQSAYYSARKPKKIIKKIVLGLAGLAASAYLGFLAISNSSIGHFKEGRNAEPLLEKTQEKSDIYSSIFKKIQQQINKGKYEGTTSQILALVDSIEKDDFSSKQDLLDKIKAFTYTKKVFVPAAIEKSRQVRGGFNEQFWQRDKGYETIKWIPPVFEETLVPAHYDQIQIIPSQSLENLIGTLPAKRALSE